MVPLIIGSTGVGILLLAFVLNLVQKLSERSPAYLIMNFCGSILAAWYAWAGGIVPFVVLEIVWGGAALTRLILVLKKNSRRNGSL
jgi:hypothetical protein